MFLRGSEKDAESVSPRRRSSRFQADYFFDGARWVSADAAAVLAAGLLFGLDNTLLAAVAARGEVVSLRGVGLLAMVGHL